MAYLPYNEDPYGGMDWFPQNEGNDPCAPNCCTMNCCIDPCEEYIDINQDPKDDESGFQVWLDVANFLPEEITVEAENNVIVVHAKQEEKKQGQNYMSREFVRSYELPPGYKPEDVIAILSCDGILQIKAPNVKYRSIPIQVSGPLRMCMIENIKNCDDTGDKDGKKPDKQPDPTKQSDPNKPKNPDEQPNPTT